MKKITQLTALAIGLIIIAPSCKKYEDGPSISLRTKKGRISGDWTLSAIDEKVTDVSSSSNTTVTTTASADGSAVTVTVVYTPSGGSAGTTNKTGTMTTTLNVEKDGTYKSTSTQTLTYTQTGFFGTETVTEIKSTTDAGTWNFTGGIGDLSKKEQVLFRSLSSTETNETNIDYASVLVPDFDGTPSTTTSTITGQEVIYTVLELKNKEMKITRDWSDASSTDGSSNGSTTGTATITFKQ